MTEVIKPTLEEIKEAYDSHEFEEVYEELDDNWRHGNYVFTVYKRLEDNTYWSINYQVSGDGEYNSLRDGDCRDSDISQVEPYEVTTTKYKPVMRG